MDTGDQEYLNLWRNGRDPQAFQQLVNAYAPMVFGTGRRITGSTEDAEDIAQECFLKLAKRPPSIQYSLGSWLHRVATNHAINLIKKRQSTTMREQSYEQSNESSMSPETEAEWAEIQQGIDEAIDGLPEKYKDAIIEHFLHQQSHQKVSELLGVSRQTISYRVDKGIEHIRTNLRRNGFHVGAATLVSMLQAITVEAVPAALSTSLTKLAISGIGLGGLSWFSGLLSGYGVWTKLTLASALSIAGLMALGWNSSILNPIPLGDGVAYSDVQSQDEIGDPLVAEVDATAPALIEVDGVEYSEEASFAAAADSVEDEEDDEELPHIVGRVLTAVSLLPLPNTRVVLYPKDAVHFKVESDRALPNVPEAERVQLRSVHLQLALTPEEELDIEWYTYAKTMRLVPDVGEAIPYESDENGEFDASNLEPGDYIAIVDSGGYASNGETSIHLEHAGQASIGGATEVNIIQSDEPVEFSVETVKKTATTGRIYDKYTRDGYENLSIAAYRWTDNAYLRIIEGDTISDKNGNFSLAGLQPGFYEFEREEVEGLHGQRSMRVEIGSGSSVSEVDFPITTGAALEGTVLWGDEPLVDAEFLFHYAHLPVELGKTQDMGAKLLKTPILTDANGQYFVSGVKNISGAVYATVKTLDGGIRMSNWVRNVYIEDGDFQTVDLNFDVGTSSMMGRLTRAGKPLKKALVIWYPEKLTSGEQRSYTDAEGYYQIDGIDSGQSRVEFYLPRAFEGINRPVHIAEGETLELNIDLPENAITFTAINVPENSKSVWMWVKDANFRDADGEKYLEFIERTRHQTVSMARLFKIGSRPYKGKVWGLEPGTYHLAAVSHAAPGWAGLYLDDNEKIRKYLEQTFDAPQLITIDESTQEIEIDFEGAENRAYRFNLDD